MIPIIGTIITIYAQVRIIEIALMRSQNSQTERARIVITQVFAVLALLLITFLCALMWKQSDQFSAQFPSR